MKEKKIKVLNIMINVINKRYKYVNKDMLFLNLT